MSKPNETHAKPDGQSGYDGDRTGTTGNKTLAPGEVGLYSHQAGTECAAARVLRAATELRLRRIAIKCKGRVLFLDTDSIFAVEAEGNYVSLVCLDACHLLRETISAAATELEPYGFVRIHRSILVNAAHVQQIQPCLSGEYAVRLDSGKEYTVTRTYRKNLRLLAGYWIGADEFLSA